MRVLLCQLDGKLPNIALMRLAAHHRGDDIEFANMPRLRDVRRDLWDEYDRVYASLIFEKTRPIAERLLKLYPHAVVGGTGWNLRTTLESIGVENTEQDYSIYPRFRQSIGFTQRGCRLKCKFCVVPSKEPVLQQEKTIASLWRGEDWPRELLLLDNDFFGQPLWRERITEIRNGGFKVSFTQGINARMLTDETAEAIASVNYRDDSMKHKRIYTAWDNRRDERRLFAGLESLVRAGIRPDYIMVYMLIGYWPGETEDDWDYRRAQLRAFGARPYPMPFKRTPETVGFQRFVVRRCDFKCSWSEFKAADFRPEYVGGA